MSTPEVMNAQLFICTKRPSLVTRTTTFVLLLMFLFSLPTTVHGMVSDGSVASGSNINGFPLGVKPFWPVVGFPILWVCVGTEFVVVTLV